MSTNLFTLLSSQALASIVYFASQSASQFGFLPLEEAFGGGAFLYFAVPTSVAAILFLLFFPETKRAKEENTEKETGGPRGTRYGTIPVESTTASSSSLASSYLLGS